MGRHKRHRQFCPESLIKDALSQKWDRSLAVFIKLKSACSHGGFKSVHEASERSNVPTQTLYKHLRKLKKNGLISVKKNGYFKLLTREELQANYDCNHLCSILFNRNDTLTEIAYILKLKIVEEKSRQQDYHIKNRQLLDNNKMSIKQIRKITREYGSMDRYVSRRLDLIKYDELKENVVFTYEWLSKVLNCSKNTIGAILREGARRNMLSAQLMVKKGVKMSYKEFKLISSQSKNMYGGFFWRDGFFYSILGTKIVVKDYIPKSIGSC